MREVSQEIPQPLTTKFSLKITHLKLILNLPGINELMYSWPTNLFGGMSVVHTIVVTPSVNIWLMKHDIA